MLRSVFIKVSQLFAIIYALVFFFKFIKDSYLLIESHTTAHWVWKVFVIVGKVDIEKIANPSEEL